MAPADRPAAEDAGAAVSPAFAALYDALRARARATIRTHARHPTLQATELVDEVFLKLARRRSLPRDRVHLLALAARAMRSVLVDHLRSRTSGKRRASGGRVDLQSLAVEFQRRSIDLLDLDAALRKLAAHDARAAQIVELRFFGGLGLAEIARTLGVHVRTVKRDWQYARAWLHAELS